MALSLSLVKINHEILINNILSEIHGRWFQAASPLVVSFSVYIRVVVEKALAPEASITSCICDLGFYRMLAWGLSKSFTQPSLFFICKRVCLPSFIQGENKCVKMLSDYEWHHDVVTILKTKVFQSIKCFKCHNSSLFTPKHLKNSFSDKYS